jgi:hypothetical protein
VAQGFLELTPSADADRAHFGDDDSQDEESMLAAGDATRTTR